MSRIRGVSWILVALGLSWAQGASAFTLLYSQNPPLVWQVKEIQVHLLTGVCPVSDADLTARIQSALDQWNGVPTSAIRLKVAESLPGAGFQVASLQEGHVAVGCTSLGKSGGGEGAPDTDSTGQYYARGFAQLNSDTLANWSAESTVFILTHEFGHVLGLGHSSDPEAIMSYDNSASPTRLGQDDVDGVTFLYPRKELGASGLLGCGSLRNQHQSRLDRGPEIPLEIPFLGLFLILAFTCMKRRRRTLRFALGACLVVMGFEASSQASVVSLYGVGTLSSAQGAGASKAAFGPGFGFSFVMGLSPSFELEVGAQQVRRNFTMHQGVVNIDGFPESVATIYALEVPVLLRYRLDSWLSLGAGLQWGHAFGKLQDGKDEYVFGEPIARDEALYFRSNDFGAVVAADVQFPIGSEAVRLLAGARAVLALTSIRAGAGVAALSVNEAQLLLGLRLGLTSYR